jgi:hypothetical protein
MPKKAAKKKATKKVAAKPEVKYSKSRTAQSLKKSRERKGMA